MDFLVRTEQGQLDGAEGGDSQVVTRPPGQARPWFY